MNPEGKLILGYLGTEPSLFVAPPVQSRDLDYEAAEKELQQLRKVINESGEQSKFTFLMIKDLEEKMFILIRFFFRCLSK